MDSKKYYYSHDILDMFDKKRNKVDILFEALDFMQQHNGRNTTDCMALAMGFDLTTDEGSFECYVKN